MHSAASMTAASAAARAGEGGVCSLGATIAAGAHLPVQDGRVGRCSACGHTTREGANFCDNCGAALGAPDARSRAPDHLAEKIRAGRAAIEGERKQVTVLFADVKGSMELNEHRDAEEWRAIIDRFFSILCEGVHRFEGTVEKFTGDGIMAIFGAPIAHEDHAQRACYAALHMHRELEHDQDLDLAVRIGINSGEVVVGSIGDDLGMAYTALGHSVDLAQRMEQLAEPGSAYVTEFTAPLVDGYLTLEPVGEFDVKGSSRPLGVHKLTGVGPARGRLDVSRARGLSRFVGREAEERALDEALAGQGGVIAIVGEPGVGKSRLCHEFAERCRAAGTPVYQAAGQAHAKTVPLAPVLDLLRDFFGIGERDSGDEARSKIERRLAPFEEDFDDDLPLVFDLLAVPDPERRPPRIDPEARLRRLLSFCRRLTRGAEPSVIVVDDLQWLDGASELFIANQADAVQGTRSLLVVNFRPEYSAEWLTRPFCRRLTIAPLDGVAVDQLLTDLLGSDASIDGLAEVVRERTGGNPFFVEEVVHTLVDGGTLAGERGAYRLAAPVAEVVMPATVQAALAARIDRLDPAHKHALQAGAVIGKEFAAPVLARVSGIAGSELEQALRGLVAADFVYERELYPDTVYAFKHPLTQEVAYGSQLRERRAPAHAATASAIADLYPDRLDERAALIAHHWEAAGEELESARWHVRAALWAGTAHPAQAREHWLGVRGLTDRADDSDEARSMGLAARIFALGHGWRIGVSVEEQQSLYEEGIALVAEDNLHVRALLLMVGAEQDSRDARKLARSAREAMALAAESRDPGIYVALAPSAYTMHATGDFRVGLEICDRAIELAAGDPLVGTGINYICPYAYCFAAKGMFTATVGDIEAGRALAEEGLRIAHEAGDVEIVGVCHLYLTYIGCFAGESEAALRHARAAIETIEQVGGTFFLAYAWYLLGLAESVRGEWQSTIDALERTRATIDAGTAGALRAALAVLGEAYMHVGDPERAQTTIDEAIDEAHTYGNVFGETLGTLSLASSLVAAGAPVDEIDEALERVSELAAETGAVIFEPRVELLRADLADRRGDDAARERALREARRLFEQIGATGWVRRLDTVAA
jgi:class 3 adenylate cyclase/tetratricopeptide (TPR) repeat protein